MNLHLTSNLEKKLSSQTAEPAPCFSLAIWLIQILKNETCSTHNQTASCISHMSLCRFFHSNLSQMDAESYTVCGHMEINKHNTDKVCSLTCIVCQAIEWDKNLFWCYMGMEVLYTPYCKTRSCYVRRKNLPSYKSHVSIICQSEKTHCERKNVSRIGSRTASEKADLDINIILLITFPHIRVNSPYSINPCTLQPGTNPGDITFENGT